MKTLIISMLLSSSLMAAEKGTLDQLLSKVKSQRIDQRKELSDREKVFASRKAEQSALLAKAKSQLAALEKQTKELSSKFEKNEQELSALEEKLTITAGSLGEMFGVVKQVASDFKGQFQGSNISAQIKGRDELMTNLSGRKKLPNISELENMWFEIQREMTESGKIVEFKSPVVLPSGEKVEKTVTRVGAFNLVADGKYLSYQGTTGQLIELPRQPQSKFLSMAEGLEEAKAGEFVPFGLDPSRGAILSMLVQAPSLSERVQQGGLVGYVILSILLLGLVLVGERLFVLLKEGKKIKAQLSSDEASEDNALGALMKTFSLYKSSDLETLELKLDESIVKSLPKFERGISTIKILSAVAPLLGLLGTVTGMIATFQSITLFGTGDPKLMAGGISTALITTVLGLVCAIPLLLLHNVVSSKSKGLIQILEEQSAGYMALKAEKK